MRRYQIENEDVLWAWLAQEPDASRRQVMLEWTAGLSEDPVALGQRLPEIRSPVYLALTPVRPYTLTYLVAEEFRTVRLIRFGQLPGRLQNRAGPGARVDQLEGK